MIPSNTTPSTEDQSIEADKQTMVDVRKTSGVARGVSGVKPPHWLREKEFFDVEKCYLSVTLSILHENVCQLI